MTDFGRPVARISGPPGLRHACAAALGIMLAIALPCRAAPETAPTRTRHVALLVGERGYLPDSGMLEAELVRTLTSDAATRVEVHREAIDMRQPGAWQRYRLQIVLIAAALLLQAGLISWLIYEHRRRQAAEILVRSSMAELSHMNRMATAGELSASIAHEVNQPLAGIAMMANAALRWLAADKPNVEKAHSLLTQIVSASHHASEVIASVRSMFKKDSAEKVTIDVNTLVSSVLPLVAVDLHKDGVELQTNLDTRIPTVKGDPVQLQQVVLNLVMNAIEAMRAQPTRVLRLKTCESQPGIVQVSVEDTGTGIAAADMQNVFKPLFTTKARGMGMGLAICRSIIEKHDGAISVIPGTKGGSIFRFELPAAAAK